jgi:hypothetical protein
MNAAKWTVRAALVLLLTLMVVVTPAAAQDRAKDQPRQEDRPRTGEVDLRPRFEKGQRLRYRLEQSFSSINDLAPARGRSTPPPRDKPGTKNDPATDDTSRGTVEMVLLMNVQDVSPAGVATVETKFESLKLSSKSEAGEFSFDSTKPQDKEDPIALLLGPIAGTSLTLQVDRAGNVTSVTGGEALNAMGQMVSGSTGGASQLFGPIFSTHPTTGFAKVGQSWEHEDRLSSGLLGDFTMKTRHTLQRVQGREAVVGISGRIDPRSEAPGQSSFQLKDSSYTGSYVWDTGRGQLSKMDTTMSVRLDGNAGEQAMSTRNESKVKITRLNDRP